MVARRVAPHGQRHLPLVRVRAVPALLADQGPDELLGLTATTAWLASALIKQFEAIAPGAAEAWLQSLAVGLAE